MQVINLDAITVGAISTLNADGSPYAVPVHFVTQGGKIYIHCGAHGQKYANIVRNSRVSFAAWEMLGYANNSPQPCRTGTNYRSVIISGTAAIVEENALKREVLRAFAVKYTPQKNADNIPDEAVARTCVIEIDGELTEKSKGAPS
jgi:nitroimidazol reductase NimA-like FMN-containing flavoprotein (pyridoxamine 5'-phosphate oxidase superfamily)